MMGNEANTAGKVVDAATFMRFRREQERKKAAADEVNADLGEEPVLRRRGPARLSPKDMAALEDERNDVLGVLEEILADLREPDKDGVLPPKRFEGYRVCRASRKNCEKVWHPDNPEAVSLFIYMVLIMMFKHRCNRKSAFRHVAATGLVTETQVYSLFYAYATDEEMKYLPYINGIEVRHGRIRYSVTVQRSRC